MTDNGNIILDVHNLNIIDPIRLETAINALTGVVTVGLFAARGADVALIGTAKGVRTIKNDLSGAALAPAVLLQNEQFIL